MAVTRCENGHFYDDGKFDACPHCRIGMEDEKTVFGAKAMSKTIASRVSIDLREAFPAQGDEKTVGIYKKKHGYDPVTGWLVCLKGPERGRDYRLHSGRNFLGRAMQMDIAITDDAQISRENHCSIVFEPKNRTFMLAPGSANTYLNSKPVSEPILLEDSDIIGAGISEFVFIPFCDEARGWES